MSSLVLNFQRDIISTTTSTTELLRTAKLIARKLELSEVCAWLDAELDGYTDVEKLPPYRFMAGGTLFIANPLLGWQRAATLDQLAPVTQSIAEVEDLLGGDEIALPLPPNRKFHIDGLLGNFSQRIVFPTTQLKGVINGLRNRLLEWSTELERHGIVGEDMTFKPEEKQVARGHTTINIGNVGTLNGVVGTANHSPITVTDFSDIRVLLKQKNIPVAERNELEDIMDDLKTADPDQRKSLLERGKAWIVKNQEFLGASANIVRKAMGFE